jgi:hypothetical protein
MSSKCTIGQHHLHDAFLQFLTDLEEVEYGTEAYDRAVRDVAAYARGYFAVERAEYQERQERLRREEA